MMNKIKQPEKTADVGVIVGRFQVHNLTDAHRELLDTVSAWHKKMIVFVGCTKVFSHKNPLDFVSRERMIRESYPDAIILPIHDCRTNAQWSKNLDNQIHGILTPEQTAVLYGSRDSFIPNYTGIFPAFALESDHPILNTSGTAVRESIRNTVTNSSDFRAGVIWANLNRFPQVYPTVDVAILDSEKNPTRILLCQKPGETSYRFVGGFADPASKSYEMDAKREAQEETGLEVSITEYIGSFNIPDWRYASVSDKMQIRTLFFLAVKIYGREEANDDISAVKWIPLDKLESCDIVEEHQELKTALIKKLEKIKTTQI